MMIGTDSNLPKLRVFTWHIHGSYLYYLSQGNYEIYTPVNQEKSEGYYGKGETFPFGSNVIEIPAEEVKNVSFDLVLFQTDQNFFKDQYEILSSAQRKLPRIFLEHDPPWDHPTNSKHPVNDTQVVLVHVTHFNHLMWDNHALTTKVITHGVTMPNVNYSGKINRGIVVINNLPSRGRLLGLDLFEEVSKKVPLDLVGMGSDGYGIGEVLHPDLPAFMSDYRFFFNPIRYTSLGLAVCEAMMLGMPVVGLATTEMSVAIKNGYSGFIHTDINYLVDQMNYLLNDHAAALTMSKNAKESALTQFNIDRFTQEWEALFRQVITGDGADAAKEFLQLGFQH